MRLRLVSFDRGLGPGLWRYGIWLSHLPSMYLLDFHRSHHRLWGRLLGNGGGRRRDGLRRADGGRRLGFRGLRIIGARQGASEVADALAERPSHLRQSLRTEHDQSDHQDEDQMRRLENVSDHCLELSWCKWAASRGTCS